jgi:thymidylate synthase (FAD)
VSDPRVTLLAHTQITWQAEELLESESWESELGGVEWTQDADHLAEIAGRQCYESWSRPNPKTASNADYLANIIRQQHTSVLAHASFTFRLTGVSRSLTHELIRHRFLAVSEVSQRYIDMTQSETVVPPAFRGDDVAEVLIAHDAAVAGHRYNMLVNLAEEAGATRKQAREAARCVLPGGTETKMIVSGNVRAWRDFIAQRNAPGADAEIREIAGEILTVLHNHAPNSVADLVGDT